IVYQMFRDRCPPEIAGRISLVLGGFVIGHVFYHRPWSATGLWAAALGSIFAAATPQRSREARNSLEAFCGAALRWIPTWLIYFSEVRMARFEVVRAFEALPILAGTSGLFLTGQLARLFPMRWASAYLAQPRAQFRLIDSMLTWLGRAGTQVHHV